MNAATKRRRPGVVPDGYKMDAQGRLVPIDSIRPIDSTRDELVVELVTKAKLMSETLATMKAEFFSHIDGFVALSAAQYGASLGGKKGNVTLHSFDGRFKVVAATAEHINFDERLQAAKSLIDQCITDWSSGSRPEIKALVNQAFQTDKEGRINTGRVLGLRRLDITDKRWLAAMKAIGESTQVVSTKRYVRFYERVGDSETYRAISLDVANA